MPLDAWLPVGLALPGGERVRIAVEEGEDWQLFGLAGGGRLLAVRARLWERWLALGLIEPHAFTSLDLAGDALHALVAPPGEVLAPLNRCASPNSPVEVMAFADALRASRAADPDSPFEGALYCARLGRLLPTLEASAATPDDVLFGAWLTGGVPVSVHARTRLRQIVSWLPGPVLEAAILRAGFGPDVTGALVAGMEPAAAAGGNPAPARTAPAVPRRFALPGRPALEAFLLEHVIDIVDNAERYRALGIEFPSAMVLHGPPGCGKTYAVERLIEHLGWPSFRIEASSVASPLVHETSRKVAEIFDAAMKAAPAVLVIDEMEAFLADRQLDAGSAQHRVEEVAEFLRRIPEAVAGRVLIVAMTNRIEMIDPAILRRGRFDHLVEVGMASEEEVLALLGDLVGRLPHDADVDLAPLARRLAGRPLSDVSFVVREAARLAARAGAASLGRESLEAALAVALSRGGDSGPVRRIGFT